MPDRAAHRAPRPGQLLPTLDDLPAPGPWLALPADEPTPAGGTGDALVELALDDLDADLQIDTAASPRFSRPPAALVHAVAAVAARDADALAGRLLDPAFGRRFAEGVAADVRPAGAELLGTTLGDGDLGTGAPAGVAAGGHRVSFAAGDPSGAGRAVLDLVVLARGPAVLLVWFADRGEPFPADQRADLVAALATRLTEALP